MGIVDKPAAKGFTLLETLIALVILSIGLAGTAPPLIQFMRGNSFAATTTEAATWSQDKLEELRDEDFTTLSAMVGTTPTDTPSAGLTRGWTISDSCSGCGDILAIEVCTAKDDAYDVKCFSADPMASHHYFTIRTRL